MSEATLDMTFPAIHNATLTQLYAALQQAIRTSDAGLIDSLSQAIQRLS